MPQLKTISITAAVISAAVLLTSCGGGGDDIGGWNDGQVTVSFKTEETTAPDVLYDASSMTVIFDALVRVMAEQGMTFLPEDSDFLWTVVGAALEYSGDTDVVAANGIVTAPFSIAADYISALLPLGSTAIPVPHQSEAIPDPGAGMDIGEKNGIYAFFHYEHSGAEVRISDLLSDGDGTYTAYVDYIKDEIIASRYILTLGVNPYPTQTTKYDFNYTVIAAAEMK